MTDSSLKMMSIKRCWILLGGYKGTSPNSIQYVLYRVGAVCVGVFVCLYVGVLVCWCVGVFVCWCGCLWIV